MGGLLHRSANLLRRANADGRGPSAREAYADGSRRELRKRDRTGILRESCAECHEERRLGERRTIGAGVRGTLKRRRMVGEADRTNCDIWAFFVLTAGVRARVMWAWANMRSLGGLGERGRRMCMRRRSAVLWRAGADFVGRVHPTEAPTPGRKVSGSSGAAELPMTRRRPFLFVPHPSGDMTWGVFGH